MSERPKTTCCIVGGGPAGMMAGLLLARDGVEVVVLEKHADFLRDFRGDTIHPSTLDVMAEIGLLDRLLQRPHRKVKDVGALIGGHDYRLGDLSHLPTRCKFIALMPQWDFLDLLAEAGRALPGFGLRMRHEAVALLRDGDRVTGVQAKGPDGPVEIAADLVIAADGRHSHMREQAALEVLDQGAPIDVMWLQLPRREDDQEGLLAVVAAGRMLVLIDRGDYWQCACVVAKGDDATLRTAGLGPFREHLAQMAPFLADRVGALESWDDVKLLTVTVDRLKQWHRKGLLCIGDAAHAMSPVGGIGINLAIQDAVAAANLLARALREHRLQDSDLAAVQRRRSFPTRATQAFQVAVQNRVMKPILAARGSIEAPWPVRLIDRVPYLRRFPARLIGVGFRPEHVRNAAPSSAA